MCRVLNVHRSGFYALQKQPESDRAKEDRRLLGHIKQFWIESGFAYGYRNITLDMKDMGETCGKNRVHRIMREAGIRSQRGYKRHRGFSGGDVSQVAENVLDRQFDVDEPNRAWVTDFTFIRTHEGWLYLTVVVDLFSRQVDLREVQQELLSAGITTPQIHVLSYQDADVQQRQLHEIEAVLKKDVVHGTEVGAVIGVFGAAAVLILSWLSGISETYTWTPAIFLAIVVLGFCTWEGGLIGIGEKHVDFQRFEQDLQEGRHVLLVDIDPDQKSALDRVTALHPGLANAGTGKATPKPVVELQNKWARFMELAP